MAGNAVSAGCLNAASHLPRLPTRAAACPITSPVSTSPRVHATCTHACAEGHSGETAPSAGAGFNQSGACLSLALDAHTLYLGAYDGLSSIWSRFPHLREHLVQDYQSTGKQLFSFTGAPPPHRRQAPPRRPHGWHPGDTVRVTAAGRRPRW